jgi:hypothetical protein
MHLIIISNKKRVSQQGRDTNSDTKYKQHFPLNTVCGKKSTVEYTMMRTKHHSSNIRIMAKMLLTTTPRQHCVVRLSQFNMANQIKKKKKSCI